MGVYIGTSGQLNAAYIGEWYVVPTSISLDKSSISLNTVGQTEQLTATILPADAKQTVTWTSSNTSIATVDNAGLVTCVTPGDATITATTVNGLTATCTVKEARLPSAYQEVEWIENDSQQLINTGIKGSNAISTELVMRPNMSYTSEYCIFGDAWSASALFLMEYNGKYRLHNGGSYGDFATVTDVKTTIETNASRITINGTSYTLNAGSSYPNSDIGLFGIGNGGYATMRGRFKVYSFKMSSSGVLVRDFVPCYRKQDTVIGMYDLVNDVFYTNVGAGSFTKGPDVN